MISNVLWWTFYFYICNVQKTESVKIFTNFLSPPTTDFYRQFQPQVTSKTCLLKPDQGPCRDKQRMYYFDPASSNCSTFNWGGCQGNGNRFNSFSQCMGYCQTTPETKKVRPRYCQLSFDYGFCFGSSNRWFYDSKWKVCKSTIYSGCGGNKNNFYSKEQCDQICRFGNPPYYNSRDRDGKLKVLIINPESTTGTPVHINVTETTLAPKPTVKSK